MRKLLPQERHIFGFENLYKRFLSSRDASDSEVLQRWLKSWTATPPAAPLFDGAEPPTALSWARRRGPHPILPDAMLHKLFRSEAIRVWDPSTGQIKRVKKDSLLPFGARLLFPQDTSSFNDESRDTENDYEGKRRHNPRTTSGASSTAATPSATAIAAANLLRNSVLFENEELIAINKPPGLAVQGGSGVKLSIDALLPLAFPKYFTKNKSSAPSRTTPMTGSGSTSSTYDYLKLVHRLDREVTGVLLLGKGSDATARLAEAFRGKSLGATTAGENTFPKRTVIASRTSRKVEPTVEKVYWAIIVDQSSSSFQSESFSCGKERGAPKVKHMTISALKKGSIGYLDAPITTTHGNNNFIQEKREKERAARGTSSVNSTTATAVTRYKVLQIDKKLNIAWLELEPLTGRKHQLRQHCARELGLPILGDSKYGLVRKEPQKTILTSILKTRGTEHTEQPPPQQIFKGSGEIPLFLHCRSIKIDIPGQKKGGLTINAPVPEVWDKLFSQNGRGES